MKDDKKVRKYREKNIMKDDKKVRKYREKIS